MMEYAVCRLTVIGVALLLYLCIGMGAGGCSCTILRGTNTVPAGGFTNGVGMTMIRLTAGYFVSKYEMRQREFEAVMGYNPSGNRGDELPVESLAGDEALTFCRKLTDMERAAGRLPSGYCYALPSFQEWLQFVADAELKASITPGGRPDLKLNGPLPVGSGEVNRLGIYDLRGNVAEFSRDTEHSTGAQVILGAWWNEHREDFLRARSRSWFGSASDRGSNVGFRCVLVRE